MVICKWLLEKFKINNIYWLLVVSLSSIVFLYDENIFRFLFYPFLLGFLVVYLVYFTKIVKINFDFSYSFYILHFPVIQLVLFFDVNPTNPLISFVSIFVTVLILSYFSEKYIEKKFITLGREIINRKKNATN